ncbi:AfsR/SARP family transcriptional regulator (plasmid) [Rhizobium leguminosarum]
MLSVRMLGVLSIAVDGKRVPDNLGSTCRLLSGFLLEFSGRVHRREQLADQFWGHLEPMRARAALNTALWRLRRLLARDSRSGGGQNLRTAGSEVILEPTPWLDVDTQRFAAVVGRVLQSPDALDPDANCRELEAAIASYGGPFLEGEDADWILVERERLQSLYIRAGTELARLHGGRGRYEEAVSVARLILATDPFREAIHRDLLILLLLNGQRGEALRHHERWSSLLRQELGIQPMPQTLRTIDDIRTGRIFERLETLQYEYFVSSQDRSR